MTNLRLYALVAAALASGLGWGLASAQTYPNRPVRLLVGYAPGGSTDVFARALAVPMTKELGQPVVVENKPGAGSSIAAEQVSRAAPDGYTLLLSPPAGYSVNPALNPKLDYAKNLLPVTLLGSSPLVVVVNANSPIMSINDLMAAAKKSPGTLNYATSGNGSAPHFCAALFTQLAGVDMVHVPFKGGAESVQSLLQSDNLPGFWALRASTHLSSESLPLTLRCMFPFAILTALSADFFDLRHPILIGTHEPFEST